MAQLWNQYHCNAMFLGVGMYIIFRYTTLYRYFKKFHTFFFIYFWTKNVRCWTTDVVFKEKKIDYYQELGIVQRILFDHIRVVIPSCVLNH